MKKRILTWALFACSVGVSLVGCTDSDEKATLTVTGYFTVDGDVKSGYTLYQDYGGIVKLDMADLISNLGADGFGTNERIYSIVAFDKKDLKDVEGGVIVENAKLVSGSSFTAQKPISAAEAETKGVTAADSTFSISRMYQAWCYRGYMNFDFYAQYSNVNGNPVSPSLNLVYDPATIEDDKIELLLCFNRHTSAEANLSVECEFFRSFSVQELLPLIPGGKDTVDVVLRVKGAEATTSKVARKDFVKGNYLPYKD